MITPVLLLALGLAVGGVGRFAADLQPVTRAFCYAVMLVALVVASAIH